MIVFNNIFDIEIPRQITLQIDRPDSEGWRKYRMELVKNKAGEKLLEFEYSFSNSCIELLKSKIKNLLEQKTDRFDFEPIEPAFSLEISTFAPDEFKMLCIVDVSYVANGPATETGIGMVIVVSKTELKDALAELESIVNS